MLFRSLEAAGATVKGSAIFCPFHADEHPSGGVFQGKDGKWRFKCQGCGAKGDVFDIRAMRTGKSLNEILRENAQDKPQMENAHRPAPQAEKMMFTSIEACYAYLASKYGGKLESLHEYPDGFSMVRWRVSPDKKEMRPLIQKNGGFVMTFPDGERPLYRRDNLADAKTILITEGEGKSDLLAEYGFPSTTSSGGFAQASYTDWTPLLGRQVIIWPDADTPGKQYCDDVRKILEGLGCQVKIIDTSRLDLQSGEDAADFIQQLRNAGYDDIQIRENLIDIFKNAQATGPAAELDNFLADVITGKIKNILTGFSSLDSLIQIVPENLVLVCGSPGAAKSLWMLQLLSYWLANGIKAACFMLERGRPFHLSRVLAQLAGVAQMTRIDWIRSNPELVREALAEHRETIDRIGRALFVDPLKSISQVDIIQWATERGKSGHKILIVDPVTLRVRSGDAWSADEDLIRELKSVACKFQLAIVCVLHPVKGQAMPDLSSLSGGAIFGRACDSAIWLEHHHTEPKISSVVLSRGFSATQEVRHNRSLIVLKSRDGSGIGAHIACELSAENLMLTEIGLIVKSKKRNRNEQ